MLAASTGWEWPGMEAAGTAGQGLLHGRVGQLAKGLHCFGQCRQRGLEIGDGVGIDPGA